MSKSQTAIKRILLGRPMASGELSHTLLPKALALPVFASDPLSSNAYATQEAMLVLATVGTVAALNLVVPISIAVACLLAIVVTSYRQTVRAYPGGGGAYRVSHENLGKYAGLTAASALLIDYVMTVAVSMTAGVDAMVSAAPDLADYKVLIAVGFIALVTMANLRGARESGVLFAIPTYGFVVAIYAMLITGFMKCLGGCPLSETANDEMHATATLGVFLVLKAFSAGTTALTGVEAISDGVQAFRYPQSRNAANTLAIMGGLTITMFLGITLLANGTRVRFTEESERTVLADIAHTVFEGGTMFYLVVIMAAAILILAANTAYQDFPRLSSILAADRFMPHQFMNRGDRLVFSNGVIILAVLASLLIWYFDANLNSLIQLYLVGVFVSFTLSQSGMVVRSIRLKPPRWQRTVAITGFGAVVTGVVLCVVLSTKFLEGAWVVVTAMPILIFTMHSINSHYAAVREELEDETRRPVDRRPGHQHFVILVNRIDAAAARAVGYARAVRPASVTAVTFDSAVAPAWRRLAPEIRLAVAKSGRSRAATLRSLLRAKRQDLSEDDFLTVLIPEVLRGHGLFEILRRPALHRLKATLLFEAGVQVLDVPVTMAEIDPDVDPTHEPARNYLCVLVSGVHNATLQALEYGETLRPTDLRAVTFGLDEDDSGNIGDMWLAEGIPHPLEIEDSPFRDIGRSLVEFVREFRPDGINRVVTVVIPEFIVKKRRHQLLHGQTALLIKRRLLFEPGVVLVSVPYYLTR